MTCLRLRQPVQVVFARFFDSPGKIFVELCKGEQMLTYFYAVAAICAVGGQDGIGYGAGNETNRTRV